MLYSAKPVFVLGLLVLVAGIVAASMLLSRQSVAAFAVGDYASYRCSASGRAGQPVMQVMTLSSFKAMDLGRKLCAHAAVQASYSAVHISWRKRGTLTAQDIVDQHYDLILNRRYLLHGLVPEFEQYYSNLLNTPAYDVYWVAKDTQPELTAEYFADKTLGLSEDFFSQSFYLLPSNALLKAGIHLRDEQKRFYPDVAGLYNALLSGEVDIITNPDIGDWLEVLGPVQRLKLEEPAPSGSWFIKRTPVLAAMECSLRQAISRVGQLYEKPVAAEACL